MRLVPQAIGLVLYIMYDRLSSMTRRTVTIRPGPFEPPDEEVP